MLSNNWSMFHRKALYAARNGDLANIKRLVEEEGFDVHADLYGNGWNMTHAAALYEKWDCLRYLVDRDPSLTRDVSKSGTTALHKAIMSGCPTDVIEFLVKNGADPLAVDEEGTILHCATKGRNNITTNLFYILRELNVNINIRNSEKKTALEELEPYSQERLLLLAADLGRSRIKSKEMRREKKRELSELLSRNLLRTDSQKLDPVDIFDFMVKENILDKELINLAQLFLDQVFQQALISKNLDCAQKLINEAIVHQGNPKWAPLKQDKEGRSCIWSSVHQERPDKLGAIIVQLGSDAYHSGLVMRQIICGDPIYSLMGIACQQGNEIMIDLLMLMLEKCPPRFQKLSTNNTIELFLSVSQSNHNILLEKLLETELLEKNLAKITCENLGYHDLLHKYVCSPLLALTATHSILSMRNLGLPGKNDPLLSKKKQIFKDDIAAYSTKRETTKDRSIVYMNSIQENNVRCTRHLEKKRANCAFEPIQTVQRFQESLNKPASPFFQLKPCFKMTDPMSGIDCVDMANNLNISIEFENLRPEDFSLTDGAMALMSAKRGQELMPLWIEEDNSIDMQKLLQALLSSFKDFLKENYYTLPAWMDLVHTQAEWSNCETCLENSA